MRKLTLNNQNADLGTARLFFTKECFLFDSFESRAIPISNAIELPKSQQNTLIFENPSIIASTNRSFQKVFTAEYYEHTLLFKGIAVLIESNNTYTIQLIDASREFWDYLTKSIKTLAKDSDDFVFGLTAYDVLKFETDSILIWNGLNNHISRQEKNTVLTANDNQRLRYSRPSVRVSKIRERTFDATGWTFNPIQIYDPTQNLCIPTNCKDFFVSSYHKNLTGSATFSQLLLQGLTTYEFMFNTTAANDYIIVSPIKRKFRLRGTITTDVSFQLKISGTSNPGANDVIIETLTIPSGTNEIDLTSGEFSTSENSMTIEFQYISDSTSNVTFDCKLYDIISETAFPDLSQSPLNDYKVFAFDNIPDLKILDIAKASFVLNAEYFYTDVFKKQIDFFSLSKISVLGSIDYSSKFIEGSDVISGSISDSYAKRNFFNYDNDATVPATLGNGSFIIDSDFAAAQTEVYRSIFGASAEIIYDSRIFADLQIYNDTERINELNTRILKYTTDLTIGSYANFQNLSFDYILNANYKILTDALFRTRIVNCRCVLSNTDFFGLDFSRPIYISHFNSSFIILKIENFTGNGSADLKLLKI